MMSERELIKYSHRADEAERMINEDFSRSGGTVTGINWHYEVIRNLTSTIRALIDCIREEKRTQKD